VEEQGSTADVPSSPSPIADTAISSLWTRRPLPRVSPKGFLQCGYAPAPQPPRQEADGRESGGWAGCRPPRAQERVGDGGASVAQRCPCANALPLGVPSPALHSPWDCDKIACAFPRRRGLEHAQTDRAEQGSSAVRRKTHGTLPDSRRVCTRGLGRPDQKS